MKDAAKVRTSTSRTRACRVRVRPSSDVHLTTWRCEGAGSRRFINLISPPLCAFIHIYRRAGREFLRRSGGEERPGRYPRCGGAGARIYSSRHANVGSGCPRNIDGPWVINIFRDLNHKLNPQTNLPADSCFRAGVPSPNRTHAVTIHFHEYRASRRRFLPEDETRIAVAAERKERGVAPSGARCRKRARSPACSLLRKTKQASDPRSERERERERGREGHETRFRGEGNVVENVVPESIAPFKRHSS